MNQESEKTLDKKMLTYRIARSVAIVSAIFMIIFCILVLANYFQTRTIDPLNSPALETLMSQMDERPDDQTLTRCGSNALPQGYFRSHPSASDQLAACCHSAAVGNRFPTQRA